MKKVLKTIAGIILIIALIFNLYVIWAEKNHTETFLDKLPVALIPVVGSSMEPTIKSGDAILIRQMPFHTIEVGDIVVFARDGELITHEVISRNRDSLTTKGTANPVTDFPVSSEEYKAKVIAILPLIGSLWRISASPIRFAIFALLVALLLFGSDIFNALFKKIETNEEGKH